MDFNEITNKIAIVCKAYNCSKETALFIIAQTILETGDYESRICRENKNLFGMKRPKQRITTATGEKHGHATYLTVIDSIFDYFTWLSYFGFTQEHLQDINKFKLKLANSNYSTTEDYIERINRIYNHLKINEQ